MNEWFRRWNERDGLRFAQHVVAFLIVYGLLISRRPDAVFQAQFWAEDGRVWYADAYNLGWWPALFHTWTGYFLTLPRLGAALALLVPLLHAPLLLNLIAIAIQVLPVNLLLSSRSSDWGRLGARVLLIAAYVGLPSSPEIHANITNSQWLLAFCAFLLVVASVPKSVSGRIGDLAVFLLCGLTGPFCFFLLPIAGYLAYRNREPWRRIPVLVLAVCAVVQAWALLLLNPAARAEWGVLGATPSLFVRILAGNIFLGSLIGANHLAIKPGTVFLLFLLLVAIAGAVFLVATFTWAPLNMRLFVILAFTILCATLISPSSYAPPGTTRWQLVAGASGVRYWFLPTLAFVWSLITGVQSRSVALKTISTVVICLFCFGVGLRWRRAPLEDFQYSEAVARFKSAPAGAAIIFPENPEGWSVRLVKHARGGH